MPLYQFGNVAISGQLSLAGGTVSTPGLRFGTDSTGWYRSAADQWTWETGGNSAMVSLLAGQVRFASNSLVGWNSSSGDSTGSVIDTAVGRNAAGVFEVNNGTAGTYRDILARQGFLNAAAAAAGSQHTKVRRRTGIANNSATSMITVTVPNSEHNAAIFLDILAHLGTGTDVSESSRCATGVVVLARKSGVDCVATVSTLAQAQIATVSGGGTLTLAYGVTAMSGLSSATQTFDIQLTLVVTGTITDHTAVVSARLLNSLGTGVTMADAA